MTLKLRAVSFEKCIALSIRRLRRRLPKTGSRRYIPMAPAIPAVAAVSCLFTTSLLKCDSSLNSMQRFWRAWLARLPDEADLLERQALSRQRLFHTNLT